MINVIGIGITRDNLTLGALKAIESSNVIFAEENVLNQINDLINSKEIVEFSPDNLYEKIELAIEKSKNNQIVSLICLGDPNIYGLSNVLFQLIPKYKNVNVKVYPGVSAVNFSAALLGAPLHDFAVISLNNDLIPLSEIETKLINALKANFILAIYNPINQENNIVFNRFKELVLEIKGENCFIGIVDSTNIRVIRIKNLKAVDISPNSTLIVGNDLTFKKGGKLISPTNYSVDCDIHELSYQHFKKFLNGEIPTGSNLECEYYPCHYEGQYCDFCYCPFYPCGDSSTGGYWIKEKNIWSCENCLWLHNEKTIKYLRKPIEELLDDENDLKNKRQLLLKLRRDCLLNNDP